MAPLVFSVLTFHVAFLTFQSTCKSDKFDIYVVNLLSAALSTSFLVYQYSTLPVHTHITARVSLHKSLHPLHEPIQLWPPLHPSQILFLISF